MTNKPHTLKELQALRAGWNELAIEQDFPNKVRGLASLLGKSHKWPYTSQISVHVVQLHEDFVYTFDLIQKGYYSWTVFVRRFAHRDAFDTLRDDYDELMNWTEIDNKDSPAAEFEARKAEEGIADRFIVPGDWWKIVDTLYKKAQAVEKRGNAEINESQITELAETLMIETVDDKYL